MSERSSAMEQDRARWAEALDRAADAVGGALGSSEGEVLSFGARLAGVQQRAGGILESASRAAVSLDGPDVLAAREGLASLVDRLARHFEIAWHEIDSAGAALDEILAGLARVESGTDGFVKLVRTLRILGVSTKIESARIVAVDSGFDTLAVSVSVLAVRIRDKLDAIGEQDVRLSRDLTNALTALRTTGSRRRSGAGEILGRTRESTKFLADSHRKSGAAAHEVHETSRAIAGNLGEIVMSMQFHDITRQEMEHARDALAALANDLRSGADLPPAEARDTLVLQDAQLARSAQTFREAMVAALRQLAQVGRNASALAETTRHVLGVLDSAGHSFLTDLGSGLAPVMAMLGESASAAKDLNRTLCGVADTASAMARFANEIELIGAEIQFIALNASVKAAHTGEHGAALGVLAEAIARLSSDTRHQTRDVAEPLRAMVAAASRLRAEFDERASTGGEVDEAGSFTRELQQLIAALHAANEGLFRELQAMQGEVAELSAEIDDIVAQVAVHERVATAIETARGTLAPILRELRTLAPGGAPGKGQLVSKISARYTTDGERAVHRELVHAGVASPQHGPGSTAEAPSEAPAGSEFGDNVELF